MQHYRVAWEQLKAGGWIYPCSRSRKDLQHAPTASHAGDDAAEALYPSAWRPPREAASAFSRPGEGDVNWRFAVPEGESIRFHDGRLGPQEFTAGVDFGDFVIWRRDDVPAYELAVVVDDAAMEISEVVRGEDLLKSTARQLLLYRALGLQPPGFFHAPLVKDPKTGERLAKRQAALSLRAKREAGALPGEILGERVGR
jgi:glutamyl-tRNA synthetase